MRHLPASWILKVSAGLALAAYAIMALLIRPLFPPLAPFPTLLGQALALAGGTIHLGHYALPGDGLKEAGVFQFDAAFAGAARIIEATYEWPFHSHASMAPE